MLNDPDHTVWYWGTTNTNLKAIFWVSGLVSSCVLCTFGDHQASCCNVATHVHLEIPDRAITNGKLPSSTKGSSIEGEGGGTLGSGTLVCDTSTQIGILSAK